MKKFKKIFCVSVVSAIVLTVAAPFATFALPSSYSGYRYSSGGNYYSYTWTNGYETGGNVRNTVMAYLGDTSYARYRTTTGENSVSSQGTPFSYTAYHGVGTGNSIQYTWAQN